MRLRHERRRRHGATTIPDTVPVPAKNRTPAIMVGCSDRVWQCHLNPVMCSSRLKQITDGTSKTYCVGEAYMNPDQYLTGVGGTTTTGRATTDFRMINDDQSATTFGLIPNRAHPPTQDTPGALTSAYTIRFRQCSSGCIPHGVLRRVRAIAFSYDIDLETHRQNGHRADGGQRTDTDTGPGPTR